MILNGSFYTISALDRTDGSVRATIDINAGHKIFEGHFPSVPVLPGVCMVQIIKELLTDAVSQELMLRKADHLKFMTVINPKETKSVKIDIQYSFSDSYTVTAAILNEGVTYFKFKGSFGVV